MQANKLRNAIDKLLGTMRTFEGEHSIKRKLASGSITLAGKEHRFGTDHTIETNTSSAGSTKTCTCGWTKTFPREDNWGDIRKAGIIASRHLEEHAVAGDIRRSDT